MKYNVLQIQYKPTGLRDEKGQMIVDVSWKKVGVADSFEDAKAKFGGYPVIQEAK